MSEPQTESPPVTNRWVRISIAAPPEGLEIELSNDGALWRSRPRKTVQVFQSAPDPEADAARLALKQEQQFERHVIEWAKGQYLALFEAEPEAPASPAPSEEHKFPAPHEKLTDWDVVGANDAERGVLKAAMEEGESVGAAKRRLYPILNEELSRLQNQEALLGASTPESVSARRKEVESLLGILARVGDA